MNLAEKAESVMNQAVIEAGIRNIRNFIPAQHLPEFDKAMTEFLPKAKEFLMEKLDLLNQKCGVNDEDKKFFVLHNVTGAPEVWVYPKKTMAAMEGEVTVEYPLAKLVEKINKYEKMEDLIVDLITMKIFDLTDMMKP